jgi:nitrite reductase/ring-hydroxylating ferredoxin subunit
MTSFGNWHPIALSKDLAPGRSTGTRLFDKEYCIWRDTDGVAHVWEDRCPHRGMRLSFGFVRGSAIACLYHGWQYDARGQCRFIPAHPKLDVPSTIRVATFPCRERLGMVWMNIDQTKLDQESGAPSDLPIEDHDVTALRSLYIDCAPAAVTRSLTTQSESLVTTVALFAIKIDGATMIAGLQPFQETKSALHIVLPGGRQLHDGAARYAAAIQTEQLRRDLEDMPPLPPPPAPPARSHEALS